MLCVLRGAGQVLIFFLTQPVQRVVQKDADPRLVFGGIGASAAQHGAVLAEHRARLHFSAADFIGFRLTLFFPPMGANHYLCGAVL